MTRAGRRLWGAVLSAVLLLAAIPLPAGASPEILSVDGSYHFVGAVWGGEA